ncbi:MAG: NAD(P)-dependent oxidoreductase [Actinobacteria bacterium]|nr:NAD(P)-dependent oxidoreductase [Actinomycetota bacterium]
MTTIAVLGTGIMGAPMARNLADAGHDVRVWNRTREKAAVLAEAGVTVGDTPGGAVHDAAVVITMLSDGPAVDAVIAAAGDRLDGAAVWLQMSTVGVAWSADLAQRADELGVVYVDAPVLGTRQPAEAGELVVLAAGAGDVRERVQPVFDVVGSRTLWLDTPGQASRLKLVINNWIAALTGALAESIALADHLELDPRSFLDAIDGGTVGAPYAQIKGALMIDDEYPTSFPARLASKDVRLVLEAAGGELRMRVAGAVAAHFAAAVEAGDGEQDMAVVRRVV